MCWHTYDCLGSAPCFIYLIECDDYYKIGRTVDHPEKRLATLQTGSPHEMTLVGYFEAVPFVERWFHREFKDLHVRGEWFHKSYFIEDMFIKHRNRALCEACAA